MAVYQVKIQHSKWISGRPESKSHKQKPGQFVWSLDVRGGTGEGHSGQDPKARPRPLELLSAQSFGHLPEEASGFGSREAGSIHGQT